MRTTRRKLPDPMKGEASEVIENGLIGLLPLTDPKAS